MSRMMCLWVHKLLQQLGQGRVVSQHTMRARHHGIKTWVLHHRSDSSCFQSVLRGPVRHVVVVDVGASGRVVADVICDFNCNETADTTAATNLDLA